MGGSPLGGGGPLGSLDSGPYGGATRLGASAASNLDRSLTESEDSDSSSELQESSWRAEQRELASTKAVQDLIERHLLNDGRAARSPCSLFVVHCSEVLVARAEAVSATTADG